MNEEAPKQDSDIVPVSGEIAAYSAKLTFRGLNLARHLLGKASEIRASTDSLFPLHKAAEDGDTEEIERLLSNGANVNAEDEYGWTPLHNAALLGQLEAMRLLIARGADVDAFDGESCTPLFRAIEGSSDNEMELVRLLLANGAEANTFDLNGYSPLYMAAQSSVDLVRLLISQGAKTDDPLCYAWWSPLHAAADGYWDADDEDGAEIAAALIANGADVNAIDGNSFTPLHCAASRGNLKVIALLIAHGADTTIRTWQEFYQPGESGHGRTIPEGSTPLTVALLFERLDAARLLRSHGATD
jgi:ankyrin repeat protein